MENYEMVSPETLGNESFKKDYGIKYAYIAGSMYRGISSEELVVRLGKSNLFGFFGTGGLRLDEIEKNIINIQSELVNGQSFGVNLLAKMNAPQKEEAEVDLFLKHKVKFIEASAFIQITPALVRYRLKGLAKSKDGSVYSKNKIMAKISRPEIANIFLQPAPESIVKNLYKEGKISDQEFEMSKQMPMCDDICAEADSGGHTDQASPYTLLPSIIRLRDEFMQKYGYPTKIRVGAAGGLGTAEAAAAAFILGADYILTGSINQCSVEAGISDDVKDMLQNMNIQNTAIAPSGYLFEMGSKVQVLNRGTFFPVRANKLYELYQRYDGLDQIPETTRKKIQEKYFGRTFEEIFEELKEYYLDKNSGQIEKAERNPKHKMALVFKWYFRETTQLSLKGDKNNRVNYQVHCGPSLGAFNQSVKGTKFEDWRNRHVDHLAEKVMTDTADLLNQRFNAFTKKR
jgi:trans-AT polyketide synthase/acyltransferase/oxidoreductase domain-containing protein